MQYLFRLPTTMVVAIGLTLSGCTTMESQSSQSLQVASPKSAESIDGTGNVPVADARVEQSADSGGEDVVATITPPTLYRGTDEVVRMPKRRNPIRLRGDAVSLNFEQAPLTEVVHAIMGDILELDYVVEHPIGGEVTLRTRTPVPRDQLLDILESLLKANSALMVRDKDGRFFVSGSGQMSRLKPSVAASSSGLAGFSTIIVPLHFISASSMADILRPVAEETAFVRIDDLRNLLMLAGTRTQLEGWQDIITTFDVDMLKGMSVGIFPIENSTIEEIETGLAFLLNGGGEAAAEGVAGLGSVVRIIGMPRLGSILVVTPRAHYLKRIKTWIDRLDQAPDANSERRLYVFEAQNSSASHLAELLSSIFGGAGGSSGSGSRKGGVAPGMTPERVTSGTGSTGAAQSSATASRPANFSVGDVQVVADEANNALLIYATGKEYKKIEPALKQLDIAATQVIIEASIIEVTLSDNLEYGLEWAFSGGLSGGYSGEGRLRELGINLSGFSYSVLNAAGDIKAVLNALATENLLNVISSPSIMVLDNQTATIQVGDQVPVSSGTTFNDNNVTESISYKDTGVQLSVTPSVNAGGMVTMDIDQSVTDVGSVDAATGQRAFLERKITSRVAVRSSESVVLGGLIRENKSEGSSGIPLLHNLPLIGPLFGTRETTDLRTELLVIITPRVIYSDAELREVSQEMRAQMRGLELIDPAQTSAFLSDPKKDKQAESE